MKVITKTSADREVTLGATIDELLDLYNAVKPGGRSTKRANTIRAEFAELLRASDGNLASIIAAAAEEDANAGD